MVIHQRNGSDTLCSLSLVYLPVSQLSSLRVTGCNLKTPVLHLFQAVRYRMYFLLVTAVAAGVLELIGWAGRLWSSYDVLSNIAFSMQ